MNDCFCGFILAYDHDHNHEPDQSGQTNFNLESNGTTRTSCWSDPDGSSDQAVFAARQNMRSNSANTHFLNKTLTRHILASARLDSISLFKIFY